MVPRLMLAAASALLMSPFAAPAEAQVTFDSAFGSPGSGLGQFNAPLAIKRVSDNTLWVADYSNGRVQHFTSSGAPLGEIGTNGTAAGQMKEPSGVDRDASGNVWVADGSSSAANNRLDRFGPAPSHAFDFAVGWDVIPGGSATLEACTTVSTCKAGVPGSGDGQFDGMGGVAVAPNPDTADASDQVVYAGATSNTNLIQKFDTSGGWLAKFGGSGSGNGQLGPTGPGQLAANTEGTRIYAADMANDRVVVFDQNGSFVRNIGNGSGSNFGQMTTPIGVDVDTLGNVYVSELTNNRIQKFGPDGQPIWVAGWGVSDGANELQTCTASCLSAAFGSANGQFALPYALAASSCGQQVWVADAGNNRIQELHDSDAKCPSGGGGGGGNVDTTAPKVERLAVDPSRIRLKDSRVRGRLVRARGGVVRYSLTEDGSTALTFQRALPGFKVGPRCHVMSKRRYRRTPPRRRCTAFREALHLTKDARSGDNRLEIRGGSFARRMPPGRYKLVAQATDKAGNRSTEVSTGFSVLRPRR